MNIPWLELIPPQGQEELSGPNFSDYLWQVLFAFQIEVPEHKAWTNLRWGFNAEALFGEAMN